MKKHLLVLAALIITALCQGQSMDPELQKIIRKMQTGQQITQAEQKKLQEWSKKMTGEGQQYMAEEEEEDQYDEDEEGYADEDEYSEDSGVRTESGKESNLSPFGGGNRAAGTGSPVRVACPVQLKTVPPVAELSQARYVTLAGKLMTKYGASLGTKLPEIKQKLMEQAKPTGGADMAAIFHMSGSGAAAIYCAAWSAERAPLDILTANTLGVALKDMKDYTTSLQVLKYADSIRPDIPIVVINMGWACYEMGDPAAARLHFERALHIDPDLTSPHLGLGMIAECAGDHFTAIKHLRIALADSYSAAGFAAYRQAKTAADGSSGENSGSPETPPGETSSPGGIKLPDLQIPPQPEGMTGMKPTVEQLMSGLDGRIARLTNEILSVSASVRAQQARAASNPDGSLVFRRDFANELMMLDDVTALLFGPDSNFGMALTMGQNNCNRTMQSLDDNIGTFIQDQEKYNRLLDEKNRLSEIFLKKIEGCGDNEQCFKKAEAEAKAAIDPLDRELEQVEFRLCKNTKRNLDMTISCASKYYTLANNAFKPAVYDYYAFTDPILERIYSPSLNEMLNLQRELRILLQQKALTGMALSVADMADGYRSLTCIEPPQEKEPQELEEPELPKKKEKPCPLGDGIKGGFGGFSAELTCDHVTISGGEGLLGSLTRDFNTHQTKIWVGAGAKAEYGNGNLTGEATVGVEVVLGNNYNVDDIALTSSVKTGLGGLVEAEVSGRISLEGGPEISATAGMTMPEIPGLKP